ncbi:MAG: hypothetical protein KDA72_04380 [Planctomycetales bacterium]|nr:hypothetical protein [Planctomycetales bacterium]
MPQGVVKARIDAHQVSLGQVTVLSPALAQQALIFWQLILGIFLPDIGQFLMPSAPACVDNKIAERTKVII